MGTWLLQGPHTPVDGSMPVHVWAALVKSHTVINHIIKRGHGVERETDGVINGAEGRWQWKMIRIYCINRWEFSKSK